jgi:Fe-S-cluster containining protein
MTILEHFINPPEEPSPTGEALCLICAQAGTCCCRTDPNLTYLSFPLSAPEWQRLLPYACLASTATSDQGDLFEQECLEAEHKALTLLGDSNFQTARQKEHFTAENSVFPGSDDAAGFCPARIGESGGGSPDAGEDAFANGAQKVWNGDAVCAAEPNAPDFIASMCALFRRDKKRIAHLFPQNGTHYTLRTRSDGSCVFLGKNGCRLPRSARPRYCLLFPVWMVENSLTLFVSEQCLITQKAHSPAHGAVLLQQHPALIRELYNSLRLDWGLALHNNDLP